MTAPYDHEALWLKAQLFLNRAMDEQDPRPFDEQALWAALALELLAKAALARVSPLLIAEPSQDGTNLLIASGLIEGDARFTSVSAKTLYIRCHRAFKPFNESEALKITHARNEYLHGSTAGFTSIPAEAWWPRYWAQAIILISALNSEVEDLVGFDRKSTVEKHLAQNQKNIEHRTEMLINHARQRVDQWKAGTLPAKVAAQWAPGEAISGSGKYSSRAECPACDSMGIIEGEEAEFVEAHYNQISDDDYEIIVELRATADAFLCGNCGLFLDSYELIEEANMDVTFEAQGDIHDAPYGSDYGND